MLYIYTRIPWWKDVRHASLLHFNLSLGFNSSLAWPDRIFSFCVRVEKKGLFCTVASSWIFLTYFPKISQVFHSCFSFLSCFPLLTYFLLISHLFLAYLMISHLFPKYFSLISQLFLICFLVISHLCFDCFCLYLSYFLLD